MKKKASVAVVIFLLFALVLWLDSSRGLLSFDRAMGGQFDQAKITQIDASMHKIDQTSPSQRLTLTPENPGFQALLALLNSGSYQPVTLETEEKGEALDCDVFLNITQPEGAGMIAFSEKARITLAFGGDRMGHYQTDGALQEKLLTLLLELADA